MRPTDRERAKRYNDQLLAIDARTKGLPGIRDDQMREVYIEQLIESVRRIEFVRLIRDRPVHPSRADPNSPAFDPLRAAVFHIRNRNFDEAFWLVFLFVHFGKHSRDGYRLVRDIYGALGAQPWTWARITADPVAFRRWLAANENTLRTDGVSRRFGNHRKYETTNANAANGTAAVIESYVAWVLPHGGHQQMIQAASARTGQNSYELFGLLYDDMKAVHRFGRLAKFDYLTMLQKLGLASIEPGSAYLNEATGPRKGAKLIFANDTEAKLSGKRLDEMLIELDRELNVGMQVLEDSLCNWQKSPREFISFRG
ncbi:MAG: hypothetical protein K2P86_01065 [Xanthobacteraceae bacterium]|jgi:hypothetical protein|nr:hypothetical protein [Xanthobacteraceae bacterium]